MAFFGIIAREAFFINSHRMVGGAVKIGLFFDKWQLVCSRLWNFKFYISKLFCNFVLPSKNVLTYLVFLLNIAKLCAQIVYYP